MTSAEIGKTVPFKPFVDHPAAGWKSAVSRPDPAPLPPGARIAVVRSSGDDACEHVDQLRVEPLKFSNRANGNGRQRRKAS